MRPASLWLNLLILLVSPLYGVNAAERIIRIAPALPPPPAPTPFERPESTESQASVTPVEGSGVDVQEEEEDEPHPDLQVLFIMDWAYPGAQAELSRLEMVDGVFNRLREQGWTVGVQPTDNLRIVSADQVRELVQRLDLSVFPSVVAMHGREVVRSFQSGCTTPLDEQTFAWLRTGVSRRPVSAPMLTATVETSGSYPLRGGHWSIAGSYSPSREQVIRHLRGANHASLIPVGWSIENWSYEELRSLHDDLHERNRPRELVGGNRSVGRSFPAAPPRTYSSYPPALFVP